MTDLNEIKKMLYREKPEANYIVSNKDGITYGSSLKSGQVIYFTIPFYDIGDAKFYPKMESQLLIRWIGIVK